MGGSPPEKPPVPHPGKNIVMIVMVGVVVIIGLGVYVFSNPER